MSGQLERCEREWHELEGEFQELQETHRIYKQKLEELAALQTLCSSSISKQKKHLKDLKLTLQRCKRHTSQEEAELVQQMAANIKERQDVFFDMEAYLPKKNGLYLNLVLGNVNVTLLSNQAKFAYKDEYEKFKLYLTIILLLGAVACRFVLHYRIKGWWVSHHYVSTFLSGVMLTWPNGPIYQKFRNQFLAFSIFQIKTHQPSLGAERRCCPVFWGHHALSPGAVLPLQAAYSSCNIITRGAASTGCGPWGRGTTWILQWKGSSPGCGGASPFSCPSSSVAISGSSTMPSRSLSSPATRNAENGRCSCWRSPSSSSSSATS
ncbi:transmembrane protein 120B isoform X3 [Macaca fascicularis]|uniref:transmembrane protein 120B isoform X3 n=1 Tax=Macaca fascicularis TaxID=9541 RepID=UPI001E2582A0|nr:transmembrane protein 120B isoform X3 [Macaca fascicularis]